MKNIMIIICALLIFTMVFSSCGLKELISNTSPATADNTYPMENQYSSTLAQSKDAQNVFFDQDGGPMPMPQEDEMIIQEDFNTEEYNSIIENSFKDVGVSPLSTFSIDVDTASYSNMRRYINNGTTPPPDAIRIEELINYFSYDYPQPTDDSPFSVNYEIGKCPWNDDNNLVMIGLKGKKIEEANRPKSNLVFLLDVSGSMDDYDKLPLLKQAFKILTNNLSENDRISIVVYAGASGVIIEGARGDEKERIVEALDSLSAGGSTAGGEGINLAYKIAKKYFVNGGNNRVILATDGDFNVGVSSEGALSRLIEKKRKEGVFLSVLGFGTGNTKDNKMEALADKGNGNYAYIDSEKEAEKVLCDEMMSTLYTIAKDVKFQIEFNPEYVNEYRLIGYENRLLNNEDFEDDTKDAGEIGAGHTVTAFYEIVPANNENDGEDKLRYQETNKKGITDEIMFVKLRYKEPDENESKLIEVPISSSELNNSNNSVDFLFASSVAEFGLVLRDSEYKANASIENIIQNATKGLGDDKSGYRKEFISLVKEVNLDDKN